jgi:hypothetical protein
LIELQTVYSVEDAHNLFEIVLIDSQNRRRAEKANEKRMKARRG